VLFNTYEFALFFVCVLGGFYSCPSRYRWLLLLVASYVFYAAWRPAFVIWLALTTVVDYVAGRVMDATKSPFGRRAALVSSVTINLSILFLFKYLDFFLSNVAGLAGYLGVEFPHEAVQLLLPLGISFYTFQSLSYVIDVYSRRVRAETHFGIYALYVSFFPQLVAGPIGRAPLLLPQFRSPTSPSADDVRSGLWLVGYGLFKKMCVADMVAPFVNHVFSQPSSFNGSYLIIATLLFSVQIYCDFSGYSDIAIGTARIMGYHLAINFRQPYFSTSLAKLWQRWHISLSTWFRDYVYSRLGRNRVGTRRWMLNIMTVFALSGLWHGAAWGFVAWGVIHGAGIIIEKLATLTYRHAVGQQSMSRIASVLGPLIGFLFTAIVWLVGSVFFRAGSIERATDVLRRMTRLGSLQYGTFSAFSLPAFELTLTALNISILFFVDALLGVRSPVIGRLARTTSLQIGLGVIFAYYIIFFGVFGRIQFIYFQF
jgi:D-alanyl-lipoteichoic acid acyltransferase DltB (MBOAT superfamily)